MDRYSSSAPRSHPEKHHRLLQTTRLLSQQEYPEEESPLTFCVACLVAGFTTPAIGHTSHPEYRRLALCAECIAYYDRAVVE
jgi:hypothetical protein